MSSIPGNDNAYTTSIKSSIYVVEDKLLFSVASFLTGRGHADAAFPKQSSMKLLAAGDRQRDRIPRDLSLDYEFFHLLL